MSVIPPEVGRVVQYRPTAGDGMVYLGQPLTATVVHVHNERLVNLQVLDAHGAAYAKQSVPLVQPSDDEPQGGGFCHWNPFTIASMRRGLSAAWQNELNRQQAAPKPPAAEKPEEQPAAAAATSEASESKVPPAA